MSKERPRDPYFYDDVPVLKNLPGIRDAEELRRAEGDLTALSMGLVYAQEYQKFNTETLCHIHRTMFGALYEWAGEFRTIQMVKPEDVLGGDTVRYAHPAEIRQQLDAASKEIAKLKPTEDASVLVFKIVRITSSIWQTHPFREGNTRCVIAFSVLLAASLGIDLDFELLAQKASYVRNALVWCTQGIYSKFEYLERIYYDAAGLPGREAEGEQGQERSYEVIGDYHVNDYQERPHIYSDETDLK